MHALWEVELLANGGVAAEDDIETIAQRAEFLRDGLPGPTAHDHGIGLIRQGGGRGEVLEMCHILRQIPRELALLADTQGLGGGGHDDGEPAQALLLGGGGRGSDGGGSDGRHGFCGCEERWGARAGSIGAGAG